MTVLKQISDAQQKVLDLMAASEAKHCMLPYSPGLIRTARTMYKRGLADYRWTGALIEFSPYTGMGAR